MAGNQLIGGSKLASTGLVLIRVAIGALFIVSGGQKATHMFEFYGSVLDYGIVSGNVALWVAALLPWVEVAVGALLIGGAFVGGGLLASLLLGIVFLVAQSIALARGLVIDCGCHVLLSEEDSVGVGTIARALGLAVVSGAGLFIWRVQTRRHCFATGGGK